MIWWAYTPSNKYILINSSPIISIILSNNNIEIINRMIEEEQNNGQNYIWHFWNYAYPWFIWRKKDGVMVGIFWWINSKWKSIHWYKYTNLRINWFIFVGRNLYFWIEIVMMMISAKMGVNVFNLFRLSLSFI